MLFSPGKTRFGLSPATRFGRRSPANWTNPGNWAWITEFGQFVLVRDRGWLSLVRDRAWLYRDLEGLYLRFPGAVTSEVWRRRVTLSEFVDCWCARVTCYPCSIVVDISVISQFSFVYLCDRTCVYRTLFCVRAACTGEANIADTVVYNLYMYCVPGDVI